MLRYLGPKLKKLKQLNINMQPGFSTKYNVSQYKFLRFNKAIMSFYLLELIEKQKLKFTFSLSEKFIKKYISFIYKYKYKKFNLFNILQLRLDSVLFNLGYCITIAQARHWIVYGHIFVNFTLVRCPSFILKKGDIINIIPKSCFIFKTCKRNLYNRYLETSLFRNYICFNTLTSVISSLIDVSSTFITYKDSLIFNYYKY